MKTTIISFILLLSFSLSAQHELDTELKIKLDGVENFQTIKSTVLNHYQNKSKIAGRNNDPAQIKKYEKQLKFWNRHFWMQENYVDAKGEPVSRSLVDHNATKKIKKQQEPGNRHQTGPWILKGPTNADDGEGIGRIDVIAFHPTNAGIMFAGSPHGGLFKTTDAGASWFPVTEYLSSVGVAGIAIHPTHPDTMFILSGNANGGGFVSKFGYILPCLGVFKTTDGGLNWELLELPIQNYAGRDILLDPQNSNTLIVATSKGIYRSTDGGVSWELSLGHLNAASNVWDIEFNPLNPNVVYAVKKSIVLKSTNNGYTFHKEYISFSQDSINRASIGVTPADTSRVYIFAGPMGSDGETFNGFYASTDGGECYGLRANSPNLFASYTIFDDQVHDQSGYNIAVAVSLTDPNVIWVGGLQCWQSTDGGFNWTQRSDHIPTSPDYMHPDVHALEINPHTYKLYCGNDGGVYRNDFIDDWIPLLNGLSAATFYHFEYANDEGDMWGGCQDNGIMEQISGGLFYKYRGGDGFDVMTDHPHLVANGEANDIYYTVNDKVYADCFEAGDCNITPSGNDSFFGVLAMSPIDEDKIYVGYPLGVYRSTNRGDDWELLDTKPANWAISSCQSYDNVIYHSGHNSSLNYSGMYRYSTNIGYSQNITPGLTAAGYIAELKITDIDVNNNDHNIVYISIAGTGLNSKVFKTTDGGTTWQNLSYDLPNVPMFSIKSDASGGIYVGSSIGVFYKRDGITHWEYFGNGLPPVPVTEIELDPTAVPFVYVSTFGRGIWQTSEYTSSCPWTQNLTGVAEGIQYQEATSQINSTQIISANPGTQMKYNTGSRIFLNPGFLAKEGTFFKTYNTGCGGAHGG